MQHRTYRRHRWNSTGAWSSGWNRDAENSLGDVTQKWCQVLLYFVNKVPWDNKVFYNTDPCLTISCKGAHIFLASSSSAVFTSIKLSAAKVLKIWRRQQRRPRRRRHTKKTFFTLVWLSVSLFVCSPDCSPNTFVKLNFSLFVCACLASLACHDYRWFAVCYLPWQFLCENSAVEKGFLHLYLCEKQGWRILDTK